MRNQEMTITEDEIADLKKMLFHNNWCNGSIAISQGLNTNCGHCSGLCLGSCSNYCVEGCKDVCDGSGNACNKSHYR